MTRPYDFPRKVMVAAFERCGGKCEHCGAKLMPGRTVYDHIVPGHIGGEATLDNCQVLCRACDKPKTAGDLTMLAKVKRVRSKHIGAAPKSRRPMPGGRNSPLRKRMDGTVERREG